MKRRDLVLYSVILSVGTLCGTSVMNAQESFETAYGNGVHHYFNGEYQKAYDSLTLAVGENAKDPRAYYYRGLASESIGNSSESDFQMGARMEAVKGGRLSIVNDALERVQGYSRITIENFRGEALLTAKRSDHNLPISGRTFPVDNGNLKGAVAAPVVVKQPAPVLPVVPGQEVLSANSSPSPEAASPAETSVASVKSQKEPMPEEGEAALKEVSFDEVVAAEQAPAIGETVAKDVVEDPMTEVPTDTAVKEVMQETTEDSLFGETVEEPMTDEDPEAAGDESPFGDASDETTDASPFGEAVGEPMTEESPLDETEPADDESPFGDASDETADASPFGEAVGEPMTEESPLEETEPADDESPFGDESDETTDASPFGEADGEPMTEESPLGETEPADDESPFGEVQDSEGDLPSAEPDSGEAAGEPVPDDEEDEEGAPDDPFDF